MKMVSPWLFGLKPRSLSRIAFSTLRIAVLSNGRDQQRSRIGRADVGELVQGRLGAVVVDHDAAEHRRVGASGAHDADVALEGVERLLHALARLLDDGFHGAPPGRGCGAQSTVATARAGRPLSRSGPRGPRRFVGEARGDVVGDARADVLAGQQPLQVAGGEDVEHGDRQVAAHAQADGGRVHHLEALLQDVHGRQRGVAPGLGVAAGVGVVHAVDPVLGHQHHVGVDLQRAQRGGRVGGEERVAGAAAEDDDAALLEVAQGATADVRFGDRLHRDRRLHAGVDPLLLEGVLQGHRVHHRAEHADVVGGGRIHVAAVLGAAPEVAAAHHQRQLNAAAEGRGDLTREGTGGVRRDPEAGLAGEELAGELQQGALHGVTPRWRCGRSGRPGCSRRSWRSTPSPAGRSSSCRP
jgi:hypothetical protein